MIKVTILYPNKPGTRFDADYYLGVHMPMAIRLLGPAIKSVTAEIGIVGGGRADIRGSGWIHLRFGRSLHRGLRAAYGRASGRYSQLHRH